MSNLTIDGVKMEYCVQGSADGPAVVLVHCLGTKMHMWDGQVEALSPHFRVIRYDCRGQGKSVHSGGSITVARLGQDLLALLDKLAIVRAHICGLSLGGMISLWFASHHPERVQRAVFANTGAVIGTRELWEARMEAVRTGGMAAVKETIMDRCLSETFRRHHPARACALEDMLLSADPVGYVTSCAALRDADLRSRISSISAPSLIIAGALDQSTPPSLARELHAAIPSSKLVVFPDTLHLSNFERPEAFNTALLDFLGA